MFKKILAIFACMLIVSVCANAVAQEYEDFSFGRVVSVSTDQISVSEYDPESDAEIVVNYKIDPNIELENIESIIDVPVNCSIDIEYKADESGNKTATYISVYEEEMPIEME